MINLDALKTPDVLQVLDYEDVLAQSIENFQELEPDWIPLESDAHKMQLEATSSRELHLRAEFNNLALAFFLSTATGSDLDNYAVFYSVERLKGAKPYAQYNFRLSEPLMQDIVIPANLILTDTTTKFEARLLNAVTIVQGESEASGTVELNLEISRSDIKTQIITTPLPFVVDAKAVTLFAHGAGVESDEEFRERILLSMADKSTAGSQESYKSFALKADKRVEDVYVRNGLKPLLSYVPLFVGKDAEEVLAALKQMFEDMATVEVFYYSQYADDLMQTRIEEMLSSSKVRPLTDKVKVSRSSEVSFNIVAELKMVANQETSVVYNNAVIALNDGLQSLRQIGTDITLSEINEFLKVTGVKEVVITEPSSNIVIADNEIGANSANTITYTII